MRIYTPPTEPEEPQINPLTVVGALRLGEKIVFTLGANDKIIITIVRYAQNLQVHRTLEFEKHDNYVPKILEVLEYVRSVDGDGSLQG